MTEIHGKSVDLYKPQVMGILNCTPDSFYCGSRSEDEAAIARRVETIVGEGGSIIDVGAMSTRPGADDVSEAEEMARLRRALPVVMRERGDLLVSVDTFRPAVARMVVEEYGVDIINDVSEGGVTGREGVALAEEGGSMFEEVARLQVPYVLMSVQPDVEQTVKVLTSKTAQLRAMGVKDIILDPGYGFGKTLEENYRLLACQKQLLSLGCPLLVGVSRKRMVWQSLGITPEESLNGTTVLNVLALERGASILRVHDVRAAAEAIALTEAFAKASAKGAPSKE